VVKLTVDGDDKDKDVSINEVDSSGEIMAVVVPIKFVSCSDVSSISRVVVDGKLYSHIGPP